MSRRNFEGEKSLDAQLWHACAGTMVQIPKPNTLVYYFPQGHLEHSQRDASACPQSFASIPSHVPCRVSSISYLADPETDEVYAKIALTPLLEEDDDDVAEQSTPEKATSFAKTLTQSDANNGGGFSVPRYCAETIFPPLDYTADPPVQMLAAKDAHGEVWSFRHIYRGTPRRHLLTTGWSNFISRKKLVAGDSIVFLRSKNGSLRVGIRRARRPVVELSVREVVEAALNAAMGKPFEVVFYPRASSPEFIVNAEIVRPAMRARWVVGIRVRMALEAEDCSRMSWFMGTVSSVECSDIMRWPNSPWRLLQVVWDEPHLLQKLNRVNPWMVEIVTTKVKSDVSPSRKRLRTANCPPSSCIQGSRLFPEFKSGVFMSTLQPPKTTLSNKYDALSCWLTMGTSDSSNDEDPKTKKHHFLLFGQPIFTEQRVSLTHEAASLANDDYIHSIAPSRFPFQKLFCSL